MSLWDLVTHRRNREIIGWMAAGVAALAAGAWTVYTHFADPGATAKIDCTIEANASVAGCRDVNTGSITINSGASPAKKP